MVACRAVYLWGLVCVRLEFNERGPHDNNEMFARGRHTPAPIIAARVRAGSKLAHLLEI